MIKVVLSVLVMVIKCICFYSEEFLPLAPLPAATLTEISHYFQAFLICRLFKSLKAKDMDVRLISRGSTQDDEV